MSHITKRSINQQQQSSPGGAQPRVPIPTPGRISDVRTAVCTHSCTAVIHWLADAWYSEFNHSTTPYVYGTRTACLTCTCTPPSRLWVPHGQSYPRAILLYSTVLHCSLRVHSETHTQRPRGQSQVTAASLAYWAVHVHVQLYIEQSTYCDRQLYISRILRTDDHMCWMGTLR